MIDTKAVRALEPVARNAQTQIQVQQIIAARDEQKMIDTKAVRALADEAIDNNLIGRYGVRAADMLRQCADEIDALNEEVQRLKIWQSQMVEKAADKSLAGYRELADTCARLSNELDALRGQALSDPEREEYFAMKKKAAEYDTLREELATAQTDRFDELQYLRTENDTLRELVREVREVTYVSMEWNERAKKAVEGA